MKPREIIRSRGIELKTVATECDVSPAAVAQWQTFPLHHIVTLSALMGMSLHELRPDIFPDIGMFRNPISPAVIEYFYGGDDGR